jgi:hypothetical protein
MPKGFKWGESSPKGEVWDAIRKQLSSCTNEAPKTGGASSNKSQGRKHGHKAEKPSKFMSQAAQDQREAENVMNIPQIIRACISYYDC